MLKVFCIGILVLAYAIGTVERNSLWDNDLTLWNDALGKSPKKIRGLNELGIYFLDRKEYEKAADVLSRSIARDKYQPRNYTNLGIAYENLNRPDLAAQAYTFAITYEPNDPTAYYNLGIFYYKQMHELDKAFDLLIKARDLDPMEPDVHLFLSYIYRERGDIPRSEDEYRRHLSLK